MNHTLTSLSPIAPTSYPRRSLSGIGVGRGAATGPLVTAQPLPVLPRNDRLSEDADLAAEAQRVFEAFSDVAQLLTNRASRAEGTLAEVLTAAAAMASDTALRNKSIQLVENRVCPAHAVHAAAQEFADMFVAAGGYLAERVTDLFSVRDRVTARLLGQPEPGVPALQRASILVARDLSPADTAALDLKLVLGIAIAEGGPTSHTAIIAAQLGLPCVVRCPEVLELVDGDEVVVDAARGEVIIHPSKEDHDAVALRTATLEALRKDTSPGATADGVHVQLLANIGTAEDAERLPRDGIEGTGLFRTEVLFLDAATAPTLEDQAATYERVLRSLADRKVVVRTIDAGADKPLAFVTLAGEENPALGVRGYRLERVAPEILATQLAALAQAGQQTGMKPWVMAPMIATADEAAAFAATARSAGIERVGVMIEVPSAALRAREILSEVDFASIGTNDLAQYTMATDRLQGALADLIDMWQPAVLDLVAATAKAGQELSKPVGVCGESASDPVMALVLSGLGISSLSMAPAAIPAVRFALAAHTMDQCRGIAAAALGARSASDARRAAFAAVHPHVRAALALDDLGDRA